MSSYLPYPKFKSFIGNGSVNASGKVYTYLPGTTTAKTTYSDAALTSANANPVVLDSNGEAVIYHSGDIKLIVQDVNGNSTPGGTIDNIPGFNSEANKYYPLSSAADQGAAVGGYATVKDIVDAVGATTKATIVFRHTGVATNTDYTFDTSETITSNFTIEFQNGARLVDTTDETLTINGLIKSGPYQIFNWTGSGAVLFGPGSVSDVWVDWFGVNTSPGTTDMTTALNQAYAAAGSATPSLSAYATMRMLGTVYKFTSQLVWDKYCGVEGQAASGDSSKGTILKKVGNFTGIDISIPYGTGFKNFSVLGEFNPSSLLPNNVSWPTPGGGYNGIDITNGNSIRMEGVSVDHHDGYGINVTNSLIGTYTNINTKYNGSDGVRLYGDTVYAIRMDNVDTLGNGAWGFNVANCGSSVFTHIVSQQNGSSASYGGINFHTDALANYLIGYTEANYGSYGVLFATGSTRNQCIMTGADDLGYTDNGTNNRYGGPATAVETFQALSVTTPGTNSAGRALGLTAGAAGDGATGYGGGDLTLSGGAADGTTGDASGGAVYLQGGAPVNSGSYGIVRLQQSGGQTLAGPLGNAFTSINFGIATLAADAASTPIYSTAITVNSKIVLFPTSANAAADVGSATGVYISDQGVGPPAYFTITHPNTEAADKTFYYIMFTP